MKWLFQSTHPNGVRRDHRHQQHAVKMFQSTHPHGGRRRYLITNVFFLVFQSTHPHGVRREDATPTTMNWQSFNPRTLTGCDRKKIPGPSKQRSFNPRTLTGCDSTGHYQQCRRDVSIHAPSRGATISVHWLMYTAYCFNPRTLTGCDGCWRGWRRRKARFNPRTLTGCD